MTRVVCYDVNEKVKNLSVTNKGVNVMKEFCHLHNHTEYSIKDSVCRAEELAQLAKNMGMKALAMTDHCNMAGTVLFYHTVKKYGLKPIMGCEVCLSPRQSAGNAGNQKPEKPCHLTLLARNQKGLENLFRISSRAVIENGDFHLTLEEDSLKECSEGLICMSGCIKSRLNHLILNGLDDRARQWLDDMRSIFGQDFFFIELQDHGLDEQKKTLPVVTKLAEEMNIPLVVANDTHYLRPEDKEVYDVLRTIGKSKNLDKRGKDRYDSGQLYFKSAEEMAQLFPDNPEAIENTLRIAEMCDVELDTSLKLRTFPQKKCDSSTQYLRMLATEGLEMRYGAIGSTMQKRLDYELNIIDQTGYADMFLIARDYAEYARRQDFIYVVRGSVNTSLAAYAIGLTSINPIDFNLQFDFLIESWGRNGPEIPLFVSEKGCKSLTKYVVERDGKEGHAGTVTFSRFSARNCMRDVGQIMGVPAEKVDYLRKLIHTFPGQNSIELGLHGTSEIRKMSGESRAVNRMLEIAKKIEGLPRAVVPSAANMVVSDRPLWKDLPLCKVSKSGYVLTQWDRQDVAQTEMLQVEILGVRTLSVIEKTLEIIKTHGKKMSIAEVRTPDLQDEKTYELLREGNTDGVYQFECDGLKQLLLKLKPDSIKDLMAAIVLYRPQPLKSGTMDEFIKRKHDTARTTYPHPSLAPILDYTYGIILYKEQIVRIYRETAGLGSAEALSMIKAGKIVNENIIEESKQRFILGAEHNGMQKNAARDIWELLMRFREQARDKTEAVNYALLAYRTAYLKAHFPDEFEEALKSYDDVF